MLIRYGPIRFNPRYKFLNAPRYEAIKCIGIHWLKSRDIFIHIGYFVQSGAREENRELCLTFLCIIGVWLMPTYLLMYCNATIFALCRSYKISL